MFARGHLCKMCLMLLLLNFGCNVPHQCIMFAKLLYLILVSFLYNSQIIVNHIEIFVCTDDIHINFLYIRNDTEYDLFSLLCMSSVHVVLYAPAPAVRRPVRRIVGQIVRCLSDQLSVS